MIICAESFWSFWKQIVDPLLQRNYTKYNNDPDWTDSFFIKNPIVPNLAKEFFKIGRIKTNDQLVDIHFGGVENLIYTTRSDWFWPVQSLILLEHENKFDTVEEELYKLLYRRSPLKVIVTYKPSTSPIRIIDEKVSVFRQIIKKSNEWFPENNCTEYLTIFGGRNQQNDGLVWRCFRIDINGEYQELL